MENKVILFKGKLISSFDELVGSYGKAEFKSPYRSTIPLLCFFRSKQWAELIFFNEIDVNSATYDFENETPVRKGVGIPSCTDLMITTENHCIGIEAKRTEPPYETVENWLCDSENKKLVLEGWLELINKKAKNPIEVKSIHHLPYQLIHRVASACSKQKEITAVVYMGFDLDLKKKEYYQRNINELSSLIGDSISIQLICIEIEKLEEQKRVESIWDSGKRDLSIEVINGIINDSLIRFNRL